MSRGNYGAALMELRLDELPVSVQMKILRTVADISAVGMAERWGKSAAYVYRVERGETEPTPLEIKDALDAVLSDESSKRALRDPATSVHQVDEALDGLASDRAAERPPSPESRPRRRRAG